MIHTKVCWICLHQTQRLGALDVVEGSSMDFKDMPRECTHAKRSWILPWSGQKFWCAHPILMGTQWMIPEEEWDSSMLRKYPPKGPYISKGSEQYSREMCKRIAFQMVYEARWMTGTLKARVRGWRPSADLSKEPDYRQMEDKLARFQNHKFRCS